MTADTSPCTGIPNSPPAAVSGIASWLQTYWYMATGLVVLFLIFLWWSDGRT